MNKCESSSTASMPPAVRWIEADAYIFDIDGTLLNSRDGVHYNAFRKALREVFGIESDLSEIPVHGNTDLGILRAVVARSERGADCDRLLLQALDVIRAEVRRHRHHMQPEVCPGIEALLPHLQQSGKLLGIASGNLEEVAWAKLEAARLRHYFSFCAFSDAAEERAEIFANAVAEMRRLFGSRNKNNTPSVCIIGDTPADILAARANSVPIIAVATGIYSVEQLSQHTPDLCLPCCEEVLC